MVCVCVCVCVWGGVTVQLLPPVLTGPELCSTGRFKQIYFTENKFAIQT